MQNKIIITELNQPSFKALQAFNQAVFNAIQQHCNSQMIPALKKAIAEKSIEKLALLKTSYLYTYSKSIRYLKKSEREFIANNDI